MCAQSTTPASTPPGLERGLRCLEMLASHPDGLRHGELQRAGGWSKTATTRVLQHLQTMGYVIKSPIDHRYRLCQVERLVPRQHLNIQLLHHGEPILHELQHATGWSSVLLYWNGEDVVCLARVAKEPRALLQRPGHITQHVVDNPYHVFFLSQLQWRRIRYDKKDTLDAGLNHAWYKRELTRLKADGYTLARNRGRLRIAAPVMKDSHCVGAYMIGHPNPRVGFKKVAKQLVGSASQLSDWL